MAGKDQKKFIENLQNLSDSLKSVVESLKEQSKKKSTNVLESFLESFDTKKINKLVSNVVEIKKNTRNINNKVDQLLKIQKAAQTVKTEKESGLFDKISSPANKENIVDGVKIISMIAGGVLAIGLAFKLIGNVDFLSVLALGASIVAISYAFNILAKNKDLTPKKAAEVGLLMTILSGSLLVSSLILSQVQELSFSQMLSTIFIGGTLGMVIYMISNDLKNIDLSKNWKNFVALPIVASLISSSIMVSSWLLSQIVPMTIQQGISALFVAGTIGISIYLLTKGMNGVDLAKNWNNFVFLPVASSIISVSLMVSSQFLSQIVPMTIQQGISALFVAGTIGISLFLITKSLEKTKLEVGKLMLLPLIIPIIATSILISSWILKDIAPIDLKTSLSIILTAASMGASMVIFGASLWVLSKFGEESMIQGSISATIISAAIMINSWILNAGNYGNYPHIMWSLGVGLSLVGFGLMMMVLGTAIMSGVGLVALMAGVLGVGMVSSAIVAASFILSTGTYGNYPSLGWASGIGLSLVGFTAGMMMLGAMLSVPVIGSFILNKGQEAILKISSTIVSASMILSQGTYGKYPSLSWAGGVGTSIFLFASAFSLVKTLEGIFSLFGSKNDLSNFILGTSQAMVLSSQILATGKWEIGYPSKEWAEGVGNGILLFASAFAKVKEYEGIFGLFGNDNMENFIIGASLAMVSSSKILGNGYWKGNYPSKEWADGVGGSILQFATAFALVNKEKSIFTLFGDDFFNFILQTSSSMTKASLVLGKGNWDSSQETQKWVQNIGQTIKIITDLMKNKKMGNSMEDFVELVNNFADIKKKSIDNIDKLANSLQNLSNSLNGINPSSIEALGKLGSSFLIISVIDQEQLSKTLSLIDQKASSIKKVIDTSNISAGTLGMNDKSVKESVNVADQTNMTQFTVRGMDVLLTHVKSMDENIAKMAGKPNKTNISEEEPVPEAKDFRGK